MSRHRIHWQPGVEEIVAREVAKAKAEAWSEGAHAAVELHNTGTRMTLRAVIPFPENPYLADPEEKP